MPSDVEISNIQSHRFRYSRWVARRSAAVAMIAFYALMVWVLMGWGDVNNFLEVAVLVTAAIPALVYIILSRHALTRLVVSPDGINAPYGILRQIGWNEIDTARYMPKRPLFLPPREWLLLTLKSDVAPLNRIPLPANIEKWLFTRSDIRIPLHVLSAPSGEVLSSIERFMPVVEMDLQPDLPVLHRF